MNDTRPEQSAAPAAHLARSSALALYVLIVGDHGGGLGHLHAPACARARCRRQRQRGGGAGGGRGRRRDAAAMLGDELVLPGDVQAFTDAPIYARTNGYLKRWYADIGKHVKAGRAAGGHRDARGRCAISPGAGRSCHRRGQQSPVADHRGALSEAAQDRTGGAAGRRQCRRAMPMPRRRSSSRRGRTWSGCEQLESFNRITAPFDGVVTARKIDVGALVTAGQHHRPGAVSYDLDQPAARLRAGARRPMRA